MAIGWLFLLNGIFRRARKVWKLPQNPVADIEWLPVPKRTDIEFYCPRRFTRLCAQVATSRTERCS